VRHIGCALANQSMMLLYKSDRKNSDPAAAQGRGGPQQVCVLHRGRGGTHVVWRANSYAMGD